MRRRDERRRIGAMRGGPPAGAAGGRRRGKLRVKGDSTRGREEGARRVGGPRESEERGRGGGAFLSSRLPELSLARYGG